MKPILRRGTGMLVAFLFVVGLTSPWAGVSSTQVPSVPVIPAIRIRLSGLMVFDALRDGTQVVRLHSDADHHKVHIRIKGPQYEHFLHWGHDYPKDAVLKLEVIGSTGPLAANARWARTTPYKPYNMADLHIEPNTLGRLYRVPDGFGPILTFHAGEFSSGKDIPVRFVSMINPNRSSVSTPEFVVATIDLRDDQLALLTGTGLPMVPLRNPSVRETAWEIEVSNDPDISHACGYHFTHYYQGFRFTNGNQEADVPAYMKYVAKSTATEADPCDARPLTFKEMTQAGPTPSVIPSRPCIPISFY